MSPKGSIDYNAPVLVVQCGSRHDADYAVLSEIISHWQLDAKLDHGLESLPDPDHASCLKDSLVWFDRREVFSHTQHSGISLSHGTILLQMARGDGSVVDQDMQTLYRKINDARINVSCVTPKLIDETLALYDTAEMARSLQQTSRSVALQNTKHL